MLIRAGTSLSLRVKATLTTSSDPNVVGWDPGEKYCFYSITANKMFTYIYSTVSVKRVDRSDSFLFSQHASTFWGIASYSSTAHCRSLKPNSDS